VRKQPGVRSVGELGAIAPPRKLVANLDLGEVGMARNDAGARNLLDIEAELLRSSARSRMLIARQHSTRTAKAAGSVSAGTAEFTTRSG
jgi:hypothetical protein